MNNYITLNQEKTITTLKTILGENYSDWSQVKDTESLAYFLEKMANDITHLKTDNQVWYDKSQELQNEVSTHLQALNTAQEWHERQKREITEQKDSEITQLKQTIQDLQTNLTESQQQLTQSQTKITELKQQIQTDQAKLRETETNLASERNKNQTLTNENNTLKDQSEHQSQRILALEADKQDLIHQLSQAQEKHQNHLSQEKSQLTQEITLIKEVIHG